MKILQLLSALDYSGAAKQALMLVRGLAANCDLRVGVLQGEGPWGRMVRQAGGVVQPLEWKRPFDPLALWRLRRLLYEFEPDRIHVWRLSALRMLGLAGREFLQRCIVSQMLPQERGQARLGTLDRWLLRRVAKVVAGGAAEAESLHALGLGHDCVEVVPQGVDLDDSAHELALHRSANEIGVNAVGRPTAKGAGRAIVCLGNLRANKGFREALRAADYLIYCFADLHLAIVGAGPFWPSLQRFREGAYHQRHMHFPGARADARSWLAGADVCWVPSLAATGQQVALEAMAAGRPVVASDLPHFREIIVDGVNGLLVPPGDQTALAVRTRQLLLDDAWRQRLGEAGRQRVTSAFPATDFVERFRVLYGLEPSVFFLQTASRPDFSIASAQASRNNARNTPTGRHAS